MIGVMKSVISCLLMAMLTVGKLHSEWVRMQGQWVQRKDGATLWEYVHFAVRL